jgi:hypothetical protein
MKKATIIIGFVMIAMATFAEATELWINEFVSDPESGLSTDEWIEIYSDGSTDLSSCYVEEGSGAVSYISGAGPGYVVIDNPAGVLNNGADVIRLYCNGSLIDEVSYSDGIPGDGKSLGRNEQDEWAEYENPTPGGANFISSADIPIEDASGQPDHPAEESTNSSTGESDVLWDGELDEAEEEGNEAPDDVPEFTTIGALLAIAGSGLFIARRRMHA